MKLFLTSYRIPEPQAFFELIGKKPEKTEIGIIPNAKDYYAKRPRDFKINETRQYIESLGTKATVIDLKNYTEQSSLRDALKAVDAIWVSGGNTFCLREAMQQSSFDQVISECMKKHSLVYAGESAGAIVAGQSLRGIESADEPAFAEKIISEGLNLVPYYICPHADNQFFSSSNAEVRELFGSNPYYVELNDSQCMIVDGEEMEILDGKP